MAKSVYYLACGSSSKFPTLLRERGKGCLTMSLLICGDA